MFEGFNILRFTLIKAAVGAYRSGCREDRILAFVCLQSEYRRSAPFSISPPARQCRTGCPETNDSGVTIPDIQNGFNLHVTDINRFFGRGHSDITEHIDNAVIGYISGKVFVYRNGASGHKCAQKHRNEDGCPKRHTTVAAR